MAEKKTTTKAAAAKATAATEKKAAAPKRTCVRKTAKAEAPVAITAENAGFKAGDVYQALAKAEKALSIKEIAKLAKISETEVILGAGWLFKEGKIKAENDAIALA